MKAGRLRTRPQAQSPGQAHGRYLEYYRHLIERASPAPAPVGEAEGNVAEDPRFPDPGAPYEPPTVIVSGRSPTSMQARRVGAGREHR